jgi:hypothetical protein
MPLVVCRELLDRIGLVRAVEAAKAGQIANQQGSDDSLHLGNAARTKAIPDRGAQIHARMLGLAAWYGQGPRFERRVPIGARQSDEVRFELHPFGATLVSADHARCGIGAVRAPARVDPRDATAAAVDAGVELIAVAGSATRRR